MRKPTRTNYRKPRNFVKQDNKDRFFTKDDIFISRIASILLIPKDKVESLFYQRAITTIRLNPLKGNTEATKRSLQEKELELQEIPYVKDTYFVLNMDKSEISQTEEYQDGKFYIQNLSSILAALVLDPKPGEKVLDMCAAPGSKTTQISSEMQNTGILIANEPSLPRLKILSSNLERCGASNVIITKKDGRDLCRRMNEMNFKFSKILIDAPCSGEGTLKSSQKTALMWNIKTIENLPAIQFSLFRAAFEVLETDGEIIYSTCTHAPEENEGVVDKILREFEGKIEILKPNLPKELKTREGITSWDNSVAEKKGEEGNNLDDNDLNCSQQKGQWGRGKENSNKKIGGKGEQFSEKSKIKNYDKQVKLCARVYPQDNKTEGFFVAKFRRIK